MGSTFAEKALARAAGLDEVTTGQIVDVTPDVALSHDNTAAIARILAELGGTRVRYPDRLAITLDHAVPAPTTRHAENHAEVRRFVEQQGITNFFEVGRGICHQVLSEEALVLPGETILGADSHTTHFGWLGAFGAGIGRSEMAAVWATGELWLRVPESIRITLDGELPDGVSTKDLCLAIIGELGMDGGLYKSVEFTGSTIETLSIDSRMVITNMMAEMGAKNAYLPPGDLVYAYLEANRRRDYQPLFPDADADYVAEHHFDVARLEPMIACPHSVDRVVPISAVAGTPVNQAFIGTCTNGRLEDLEIAARVLCGRRLARNTRLIVIPASSQVLQEALRRGYVATLLEAGATIGTPGCGPCMGNHMGVPAPGEVTISSGNRNFQGRMGTRNSSIYLGSPAVVAASAITGALTDPRHLIS